MKRLLVILLFTLSLGLAAQQSAKADYYMTYPDSSEIDVWALTGGRLAFIFWDYAGDWDVFTTNSYSYAAPAFANLGAGSTLGYWLDFLYTSVTGRDYYDAYGTTNGFSWFYIGVVYI